MNNCVTTGTVEKCPKCGCRAYTKQGREQVKYKGISELVTAERRQCKYCGCKYTINPRDRQNPTCPYCKNPNTRKIGFAKNGARKYKCPSCNKYFQTSYESGNSPHISDYTKQKIKLYARGGFSMRFIAKMFGVGATSVKRILKEQCR